VLPVRLRRRKKLAAAFVAMRVAYVAITSIICDWDRILHQDVTILLLKNNP
jgi:hypothetical protein